MRKALEYIHQRPGWPELTWDGESLAQALALVRFKQGRLLGRMEDLGLELQTEASVAALTGEVVTSSAIEGEKLDEKEVRSSIARRLGLDTAGMPKPSREVEGAVEMMLDASRHSDSPLTSDRLFGWHAALFPTGRSGMRRITVGAWRPSESGPMQVVSGSVGHERVHYEAPEAERLDIEMGRFLEWFNASAAVDPVIKAGVAHLWFVTIHPFEDGNGRMARAIADMALAWADGTKRRYYSVSAQIEAERKDYYRELEAAQRGDLDITGWLRWFLGCLGRALDGAEGTLASVLTKARIWRRISQHPLNDRQRLVINRVLDGLGGSLTTSKYAKLAGCSTDSALRDIRELLEHGVLVRNPSGGRSTSYRLADLENITT